MIYVTMIDGQVICYDKCHSFTTDDKWTTLRENKASKYAIAKIANEQIARLEFERPCKITDKRGRNVKVSY